MQQRSSYPSSYYAATAHPWTDCPPLSGTLSVDVCVIGGGIAGCAAALHLAEHGYRVALLEAQRIGWGASGRSGGQIIPGFACGQDRLVKQLGVETARHLWDISLEGIELLRTLVARHAIACDLRPGHLEVASKARQRDELLAQQRELEDLYGYSSLRFLDKNALAEELTSERYCAGLLDAGGGHLHPLNYTFGIAAAAHRAGVQIFEQSTATSVHGDGEVHVRTAHGRVVCNFALLCCNAYVNALEPALGRRIMPVGTYIAATESLGELAAELIPRDVAVSDANFILDYFRRSADHRLLFGGRVSYSGKDWGDNRGILHRRMLAVFPQLKAVRMEYAWGGMLDITTNRAPDFGRVAPNIFYLQGFSGHGIALAGMAGKLASEAIAGQAERFDLFTRLKHRPFPGGDLLRTPALVLAMLWYRLRDLL